MKRDPEGSFVLASDAGARNSRADALTDERREQVCEAIGSTLGNAYDCMRVWSAWGVGTMSADDFRLVADDPERVAEIADAAINAMCAASANETGAEGAAITDHDAKGLEIIAGWLYKDGLVEPAAMLRRLASARSPAMAAAAPADEPTIPAELHQDTAKLVRRFARALANKLLVAQRKYGYSDNWMRDGWADECRAELMRHIQKGDPRDVAAYCAFLWHHNESTAPSPADERAVSFEAWCDRFPEISAVERLRDAWKEARAAASPAAEGAAPAGWKLVPSVATDAMCIAGNNAMLRHWARGIYEAMLKAAPQHAQDDASENQHEYDSREA
ncbi:hypothetical protein WS62_25970 [Burkholderia sp. ABCPW 14]|nr:hypothetical protein WS62_25970 [Burkholderia sp. ABCPW 14]